jgi:23S rRNA (pseudouridine1915-N3)-methyltransferase
VRIHVIFPHKLRKDPCTDLVHRYVKYASRFAEIRLEIVDYQKLVGKKRAELMDRLRSHQSFALTEHGQAVATPWFARTIDHSRMSGKPLVWLIGDAFGVPEDLQQSCAGTLSLTPLTLPHEMALAVLVEQLWRGLAIVHNHPYHK